MSMRVLLEMERARVGERERWCLRKNKANGGRWEAVRNDSPNNDLIADNMQTINDLGEIPHGPADRLYDRMVAEASMRAAISVLFRDIT